MRFKGLDLNLLVAFDVLMETQSVARTSDRLHLSQPAISAALSRLREYFGDPLLVVHRKRMHPTAFADSLLPEVHACLRSAEMLIATKTSFDPMSSKRTFRLVSSDFATTAILVPLVQRLSQIAPSIRIDMATPDDNSTEDLDQGKVDLLIFPEEHISSSHPADLLFEERHVIVGCRDNPLFRDEITEEAFFAAGHVAVSIGRHRQSGFGDQHLEALGRRRNVEVVGSSFTVVPWLVMETPRLAIMHERLAAKMARLFPIAIAPLPFEFPLMREMMQFHNTRRADDGLAWLRNEMRQLAQATSIEKSEAS